MRSHWDLTVAASPSVLVANLAALWSSSPGSSEEAGHGVVGDKSESAEKKCWARQHIQEKREMRCAVGRISIWKKGFGHPWASLYEHPGNKTSNPLNEKQKNPNALA